MYKAKMTRKGKEEAASDVAELFQNVKLDSGEFEDCGVTPFSILPEEVWGMVFDLLDNSKDLQNCMNSCFKWDTLLESKRTDFLFSQVLPVLENYQTFSKSELLHMRLVSRKWNQAVLSCIQNHSIHHQLLNKEPRLGDFQTDGERQFLLEHSWKQELYQLTNNDDCEKLKNDIFTSHSSTKNPLMTRHLFISDLELWRRHPDAPWEFLFNPSVAEILERYGGHVYHLRLEMGISPEYYKSYEALLSYWLSLMPNLRTLKIECDKRVIPPHIHLREHSADFGSLPKLQHLDVITVDCFPCDLLKKLLKKCPNVSKLYCRNTDQFTCVRPKLYHVSELYFDYPPELAEKNLTVWPVQKLTLFENRYDFKRTFKFLEQFSTTLVNLTISLGDEPGYNERLHLPKLKHLHVKLYGRTCLNFLLPLTSLETLKVGGVQM